MIEYCSKGDFTEQADMSSSAEAVLLSLSFGVHNLFLSHAWIQMWSPPNRSYKSSYSDLESTSVWVRFLHHAPCCGPVHCFSKARFLLHWCAWINSKTYLKVSKHIYVSDYWEMIPVFRNRCKCFLWICWIRIVLFLNSAAVFLLTCKNVWIVAEIYSWLWFQNRLYPQTADSQSCQNTGILLSPNPTSISQLH